MRRKVVERMEEREDFSRWVILIDDIQFLEMGYESKMYLLEMDCSGKTAWEELVAAGT